MAIGDFVSVPPSGRATRIERLVADLSQAPSAEKFADAPIFLRENAREATPGAETADRRGVIGRLWPWKGARRGARYSLLRLMNEFHDFGSQQTEFGTENVGIPFPHLLLLTSGDTREYGTSIESQVGREIDLLWKRYIDPLVGTRVRVMANPRLPQNQIVAFFGTGIFVPQPGERPIGKIVVKLPNEAEISGPELPGGTPAGIYRGQSSLAFSAAGRFTPAKADGLSGAPGIFCLRASTSSSSQDAYALDWDPLEHEANVFTPKIDAVAEPGELDGAFRVEFAGGSPFQVNVIEDARQSRLLRSGPGPGEGFAIIGMIEPQKVQGFTVRRWWIDIDSQRRLVSSAMRRPRFSLVCAPGGVRTWDWSAPGRPDTYPATLTPLQTTTEGVKTALLAPAGAPFGWLQAPDRATQAIFAPGTDTSWAFDWLDFAGAVQDSRYEAERLGSYLQKANGNVVVPGRRSERGGTPILARDRETHAQFSPWRGDWKSGLQFMCGPLLLEVT
jgi:hypothetical protein